MSLWRKTRNEVAGAWRSLRYDLGRRAEGRADDTDDARPDVTSTGMSTFGVPAMAELRTGYDRAYAGSGTDTGTGTGTGNGARFWPTGFGEDEDEDGPARPRRRAVAVSAFGVLALVGAAGSYFAVVNGLGSLLGVEPVAAQPYPLTGAAPTAGAGDDATSVAGLGRGAPALPLRRTTTARRVPAPAATPAAAVPRPHRTTLGRIAPPTRVPCDCLTPPVPTPTGPSAGPSRSGTASPSASESPSGSTGASPNPTVSPGRSAGDDMMRRRHPRGY